MDKFGVPVVASPFAGKLVWTILLVAITAVWGWSFVVIKDAIAEAGVTGFLAVRFVLASACMAPFWARKVTWGMLGSGVVIGLLLAAGFVFQTAGLRYTSPTNSGLITGLALILAPVAARYLFGVRTPRATVICLGACLVGLAMLTSGNPAAPANPSESAPGVAESRLGDLLTVGCAVAFGLHIAFLSRYAPEHDAGAMALVQVVVCAIVCAVVWAVFETPAWPPAGNWPASVWWALLLTGVVGAAAAFYIQTQVQRRLSAARTSVILTTEPVFAALFGYLLAGDRLGLVQLAGGAAILASLLIAELSAARPEAR